VRFFQSIAQTWKANYTRMSHIPFLFVLVAIAVYFWVNGDAHFPNWSSAYGETILIYIAMMVIFLLWSRKQTQTQMKTPLQRAVPTFVIFFIGTYVVLFFMGLTGAIVSEALPKELFWQTVIVQVCVVATAEELMFRGVILEFMGVFMSAILFAVWHTWAYGIRYYDFNWEAVGTQILPFVFAFVIGLLLAFIAREKRFGLPATIAVHSAYNLFVVGAFFSL